MCIGRSTVIMIQDYFFLCVVIAQPMAILGLSYSLCANASSFTGITWILYQLSQYKHTPTPTQWHPHYTLHVHTTSHTFTTLWQQCWTVYCTHPFHDILNLTENIMDGVGSVGGADGCDTEVSDKEILKQGSGLEEELWPLMRDREREQNNLAWWRHEKRRGGVEWGKLSQNRRVIVPCTTAHIHLLYTHASQVFFTALEW